MGTHISLNEGPRPFLRADNSEIAKIHWRTWNIFLRTTGPILTKLGTKHHWVKGIYGVFFNEAPHPIPREDIYEIRTIHWQDLKIFSSLFKWRAMLFPRGFHYEKVKIHWRSFKNFSRTIGLIPTKPGTIHSWMKGIQVFFKWRIKLFSKGRCLRNWENTLTKFKNHWNCKGWTMSLSKGRS